MAHQHCCAAGAGAKSNLAGMPDDARRQGAAALALKLAALLGDDDGADEDSD